MTHLPRVCWLTTEFFPPETGGTGMIAATLAQALAERNLPVRVITRQTLPRCARREKIGRVNVRRIRPAGRMKGVRWRAFPAMPDKWFGLFILRQENIDSLGIGSSTLKGKLV